MPLVACRRTTSSCAAKIDALVASEGSDAVCCIPDFTDDLDKIAALTLGHYNQRAEPYRGRHARPQRQPEHRRAVAARHRRTAVRHPRFLPGPGAISSLSLLAVTSAADRRRRTLCIHMARESECEVCSRKALPDLPQGRFTAVANASLFHVPRKGAPTRSSPTARHTQARRCVLLSANPRGTKTKKAERRPLRRLSRPRKLAELPAQAAGFVELNTTTARPACRQASRQPWLASVLRRLDAARSSRGTRRTR